MRYSRTIELGMQPDSLGDWVRFEDYADLEQKLAAAEADAERYRFIRDREARMIYRKDEHRTLDESIDAALATTEDAK